MAEEEAEDVPAEVSARRSPPNPAHPRTAPPVRLTHAQRRIGISPVSTRLTLLFPPDAQPEEPFPEFNLEWRTLAVVLDAGTQADEGTGEWTAFDLGRAMSCLHSGDEAIVRRTLRRLHIRFWHHGTKRMQHILKHAGAPKQPPSTWCRRYLARARSVASGSDRPPSRRRPLD